MARNPYEEKNGGPKPGKTAEWLAWAREVYERRRASLTPEEREKEDRIRRELQARYNSEAGVKPYL